MEIRASEGGPCPRTGFASAMDQVAAMQVRLLESEERRREMETAVDVIQSTLRRTIGEREHRADRGRLAA